MSTKTQHLVTPGFLCEQFKMPHFAIMQALLDAGVFPVMTINLCPHYDWTAACNVLGGPESKQFPMIEGAGQ